MGAAWRARQEAPAPHSPRDPPDAPEAEQGTGTNLEEQKRKQIRTPGH